MRYALLLVPVLASCSATTPQAGQAPTPSHADAASSAEVAATLASWHWRLHDARDGEGRRIDALFARAERPLQLDFADGRVSVDNACNRIGGAFALEQGRLVAGPLVSTKRACADAAVMRLDEEISRRLAERPRLELRDGAEPRLLLTTTAGDRLEFIGAPTDAMRFGGPGTIVFLEIDAHTQPCASPVREHPECLRARERHYDADGLVADEPGEWMLLHHPIEGYAHEPGIRNVLRVKRYEVRNPAAGEPAQAFVLDMVVESERIDR